jgi:hypothetical protein
MCLKRTLALAKAGDSAKVTGALDTAAEPAGELPALVVMACVSAKFTERAVSVRVDMTAGALKTATGCAGMSRLSKSEKTIRYVEVGIPFLDVRFGQSYRRDKKDAPN